MSDRASRHPVARAPDLTVAIATTASPERSGWIFGAVAVWLLCYALTVLIYLPWLSAPYYADDLLFYFAPPPAHFYEFFRMPGASAQFTGPPNP